MTLTGVWAAHAALSGPVIMEVERYAAVRPHRNASSRAVVLLGRQPREPRIRREEAAHLCVRWRGQVVGESAPMAIFSAAPTYGPFAERPHAIPR